jgi:hypothetical protein
LKIFAEALAENTTLKSLRCVSSFFLGKFFCLFFFLL